MATLSKPETASKPESEDFKLSEPVKQDVYEERPYSEAISPEHAEFLKSKGLL